MDSTHGSAYPADDLAAAPYRDQKFINVSVSFSDGANDGDTPSDQPVHRSCASTSKVAALAEAVIARRKRFDAWVATYGAVPATTPVWRSRRSWIADVLAWADSDDGIQALAAVHLSHRLFILIVTALAEAATGATGRDCAITNRLIASRAGCGERVVSTTRRLLADAGWAVEAHRGHGNSGRSGFGCRPSIWHLISRRTPAASPAICDLHPKGGFKKSSLVKISSPSARRAPKSHPPSSKPAARRLRRAAPRPLAVQRLAADLVLRAPALGRTHIGAICDALTSADIDPAAWTGRQLTDALNRQTADRGWSWPDRIDRPGPFLAYRLRRLPAQPATEATPIPPRYVPEAPPQIATGSQRTSHLATISTVLTSRARLKGGSTSGAATSQDKGRRLGRGALLLQAIRTKGSSLAAPAVAAAAPARSSGAEIARQALIAARQRAAHQSEPACRSREGDSPT